MASLLKDALKHVGQSQKADDDRIDKLNHRYTAILLVTLTAFVSGKQFIGDPITCFTPSHFSGSQVSYTNSICWLKGTYYLDTGRRDIPHRTENVEFHIAYYQFVPYVLLVMAALFYFPHMLWRNASRYYGFDLRSIIQNIKKASRTEVHPAALQIHVTLNYRTIKTAEDNKRFRPRLLNIFHGSSRYGNHLSLLYMTIKLLYLINCLCQLALLGSFLSFPFYRFGYDWLVDIIQHTGTRPNSESHDSKWFPRVVMCDFMIRHLGSNQHWMAVQCNLPINLFNEVIFLIIWLWLITLTVLTFTSFIWSLVLMLTSYNHEFIGKYLDMNTPKISEEHKAKFIKSYLRWDGVLVLRLIDDNTNAIIMADLIDALYQIHSKQDNEDQRHNADEVQMRSNGKYMLIDSSAI